jgi:hypothetical protein
MTWWEWTLLIVWGPGSVFGVAVAALIGALLAKEWLSQFVNRWIHAPVRSGSQAAP